MKRFSIPLLMILMGSLTLTGCKTPQNHVPNPKSVYHFPHSLVLPKNSVYFLNEKGEIELVVEPFEVPLGWRLTGPKEGK